MPQLEKKVPKKRPGPGLSKLQQPVEPEPHPHPPVHLDDNCLMNFNGVQYEVRADDLVKIKELGRGNYGFVETMFHPPSKTIIAVKRIRVTLNNEEQKRMLIELNASMQSGNCPYMVKFYGAMFKEGDVWLCMEVMDTSLDKFYRCCVDLKKPVPESVLGYIAYSVLEALHYMKKNLNLMHRDVKPSNILVNRLGEVKLCDFGISGHLTDSVAKTINAGCKPYMAPERINPGNEAQQAYDIRSDVWSLGVTIIEIATGTHPYAKWKTPFEQLKQVVTEPPPKLPKGRFSADIEDFVKLCLEKDCKQRPRFVELLAHPFIEKNRNESSTVAAFFEEVVSLMNIENQQLMSNIQSTVVGGDAAPVAVLPSEVKVSTESLNNISSKSDAGNVSSSSRFSAPSDPSSGSSSADSEKIKNQPKFA